jgi:hypothetical protein
VPVRSSEGPGELAGLPGRAPASLSSPPPSITLSPEAKATVTSFANDVTTLLDAGGLDLLQQGSRDGFQALPPHLRSLGAQTARLVGVTQVPAPSSAPIGLEALCSRLEAVSSAAAELAGSVRLDMATALGQDAGQRAAALSPQLDSLIHASRLTAGALAQASTKDLRTDTSRIKETLSTWAESTAALHEQLKAQWGPTHPLTTAALEARTEASSAYGKTLGRMLAARVGNALLDITVRPALGALSRLFGSGG